MYIIRQYYNMQCYYEMRKHKFWHSWGIYFFLWLLVGMSTACSRDLPNPQKHMSEVSGGVATVEIIQPSLELKSIIYSETCPDYCWSGVYLGQEREEAIVTLAGINIARDEVVWNAISINNEPSFHVTNGVIDILELSLSEEMLFEILIANIGYPTYVRAIGEAHSFNRVDFWISYPDERLEFLVTGIEIPQVLEGKGNVIKMKAYLDEQAYDCYPTHLYWHGFGGPDIYYRAFRFDERGYALLEEAINREVSTRCRSHNHLSSPEIS